MGSAESIASATNATAEEDLRACFKSLTEEERAKLQATLVELKTPRPDATNPVAEAAKAVDEKKAEEPKKEEPKAEEPKKEEAKAEEPKKEEAKAEEPKKEEAKAEEPKAEEKAPSKEPAAAEEAAKAKPRAVLTEAQIANVRKGFETSDTDKSGSIEAAELKVVMKALDVEMSDAEVQVVLKSLDMDGNGKLEFEEFLNMVAETLGQQQAK